MLAAAVVMLLGLADPLAAGVETRVEEGPFAVFQVDPGDLEVAGSRGERREPSRTPFRARR
jgi:hypothetical protein